MVRLVKIPAPFHVSPAAAVSASVSGYNHFTAPCRRLEFLYHENCSTHEGTREYLRTSVINLAREHSQTEFIVHSQKGADKDPQIRAFYTNGNVRDFNLKQKRPDSVEKAVMELLNASGKKVVQLKRKIVIPGPGGESARGIWSGLHIPKPLDI